MDVKHDYSPPISRVGHKINVPCDFELFSILSHHAISYASSYNISTIQFVPSYFHFQAHHAHTGPCPILYRKAADLLPFLEVPDLGYHRKLSPLMTRTGTVDMMRVFGYLQTNDGNIDDPLRFFVGHGFSEDIPLKEVTHVRNSGFSDLVLTKKWDVEKNSFQGRWEHSIKYMSSN